MTVTRVRFNRKDLNKWRTTLYDGAKKALAMVEAPETAEYATGDHCRFCDAKPVCKTYQNMLLAEAGFSIQELPAPTEVNSVEILPAEETPDEIVVKVLTYRRMMEDLFKSMAEYALSRHHAGNPIEGLKVVEGRSIRKWKDAPVITAQELEALGVEDVWIKKIKGITAIEKEIGKGKLQELTEKSTPPMKVVTLDDPRAPIPANGKEMIELFSYKLTE